MAASKVRKYAALRDVFSGYLHEDFRSEHGSAAAALRAFEDDASPAERRRFVKEAKAFLAETKGLSHEDIKARLAALGSRWTPPSPEALIALLESFGRNAR